MESECVVFIDGSLIEDGALERRRPRRRRQLSPAMGTSPLQRKIALESRPLCQGPVDRRLAQPPLQLTAPKDPAPRLWRLGL